MQAIRVEHSYHNFASDHKRKCYGDDADSSLSLSDQNSVNSTNDLEVSSCLSQRDQKIDTSKLAESFSRTLVDNSLLDPGDVD